MAQEHAEMPIEVSPNGFLSILLKRKDITLNKCKTSSSKKEKLEGEKTKLIQYLHQIESRYKDCKSSECKTCSLFSKTQNKLTELDAAISKYQQLIDAWKKNFAKVTQQIDEFMKYACMYADSGFSNDKFRLILCKLMYDNASIAGNSYIPVYTKEIIHKYQNTSIIFKNGNLLFKVGQTICGFPCDLKIRGTQYLTIEFMIDTIEGAEKPIYFKVNLAITVMDEQNITIRVKRFSNKTAEYLLKNQLRIVYGYSYSTFKCENGKTMISCIMGMQTKVKDNDPDWMKDMKQSLNKINLELLFGMSLVYRDIQIKNGKLFYDKAGFSIAPERVLRSPTYLMLRSNPKKLVSYTIIKLRSFKHNNQITEEEFLILRKLRIKERNKMAQRKSRYNKRAKKQCVAEHVEDEPTDKKAKKQCVAEQVEDEPSDKKAKKQNESVQRSCSSEEVANILLSLQNDYSS